MRYTVILDGAVRVYPDGREVCTDTPQGWREYKRRVEFMVMRQNHCCCVCHRRLALSQATFEHQRRRGMHAAFRDDRITRNGQEWNGAAHWAVQWGEWLVGFCSAQHLARMTPAVACLRFASGMTLLHTMH